MYVCTICDSFAGQSFSTVLRHMGTHRFDPGLSIRCGINSCTENYKNFESFRSHVYRKHREALTHTAQPTINTDSDESFIREDSDDLSLTRNGNRGTDAGWVSDDEQESSDDLQRKKLAALFLLKTREERKVTQTAINGIVQDFRSIWRDSMEMLKVEIKRSQSEGTLEDFLGSLDDFFPFSGLETEYLQHKFFKDNFQLLEPTERVLGRHYQQLNGKMKEVCDCCYDIPLLEKTDIVCEQVMNSHSLPDNQLGDYCDGKLFADSTLFQEHLCSLQIQLYYDEVEVCNPIGSKAKKHKLGLVYSLLGNLHPKFRSSLKSIQLLLCCQKSGDCEVWH